MPYKRVGTKVLVKKLGRWQTLKTHASADEAERHLYALKKNVHK